MITPKNHEQIARAHGFVRKLKEEAGRAGRVFTANDEDAAWRAFWDQEPAEPSDPHRDFAPSEQKKHDARPD